MERPEKEEKKFPEIGGQMTEARSTQTIQLSDAAGLFQALRHPSIKLRSAVLKAIAAEPERPLRLGKLHDWDVIDELIHQLCQQGSVPYHRLLVRALLAYAADPRAELMLRKVAALTRDREIRQLAESRPSDCKQQNRAEPEGRRQSD